MKLTLENLWKGIFLASSTSIAIVLLTGCAALVRSSFYEKVDGVDIDGLPTTTETDWSHVVKAPPFGKINEALVQTSYEIIDSDGGSQTISQGQNVKEMDNSGQLEALKAGLNTVAEIGTLLAPMLTAPKLPSPPKPNLPEIIEEVLSNAPSSP